MSEKPESTHRKKCVCGHGPRDHVDGTAHCKECSIHGNWNEDLACTVYRKHKCEGGVPGDLYPP